MSELGEELKSWLKREELDIKADWGRINLLLGGAMSDGAESLMKGRPVPFVVRHAVAELVACSDVDTALRLRCGQSLTQKFQHAQKHHAMFGTAPDGGSLAAWKSKVQRRTRERYGLDSDASANIRRRQRRKQMAAA